MRNLTISKQFHKKLSDFLKDHKDLENKLQSVFRDLQKNPFPEKLLIHKLSGKLKNLYSCSLTYNYRIIFFFDNKNVYLVNIGSHDEIY